MSKLLDILSKEGFEEIQNPSQTATTERRFYHFVTKILKDPTLLKKNSEEFTSLLHLIRFSKKYNLSFSEINELRDEIRKLSEMDQHQRKSLLLILQNRQMQQIQEFYQALANILKSNFEIQRQIINNLR